MGTAVLLHHSQHLGRLEWYNRRSSQPHGIDNMIFTSFRYYLP